MKVKKELLIIMERSKHPLIVSAILTEMSLNTFKSVSIQNSYRADVVATKLIS